MNRQFVFRLFIPDVSDDGTLINQLHIFIARPHVMVCRARYCYCKLCLTVRLSVALRYCVKTAKHIVDIIHCLQGSFITTPIGNSAMASNNFEMFNHDCSCINILSQ